jgi:hypothetical protein
LTNDVTLQENPMVEDISFPKNLPKVSRTQRVKRAARQNEEKQKQPFHNYLNQNEDQLKDGEDDQDSENEKKKSKPSRSHHAKASEPIAEKPHKPENDTQGKRIDVHA